MADVDYSAWDGPAAMSRATQSDDPAAAYASICAGRREGDPSLQSSWALPHHKDQGDPPNADGVRNALSRLPQTEGLTNAEAAHSHLEAHLAAINSETSADDVTHEATADEVITLDLPESALQTLSVSGRRLGLRIMPYDTVAVHPSYGALMFRKGAFGEVDPHDVRLRMDHANPPTGLGRTFEEKPDGAHMEFQLSRTARADEQMALARDGVSTGASVGFSEVKPPSVERIGGQSVLVYGPNSARLAEVSTTWQPTFVEAGVTYMLHKEQEGKGPMAESTSEAPAGGAPTIVPGIDYDRLAETITKAQDEGARGEKIDKMLDAFEKMVELQRSSFTVPGSENKPKPKLSSWVEFTLRRIRGEAMSAGDMKRLALDDVVISEQPGLVPDVFTADYDDLINQDRPFLSSTRQISAPASGDTMTLPVITTRAIAGTQAGNAEKGALTTTATKVGVGVFSYKSVFGGADISIQFINRAQAGFFEILTGDMGMAYALDCEAKAIAALIAGYTDSASHAHAPTDGGVLDPEDPHFGDAWVNSITSGFRRAPTHIWMSALAVGAFIDAKAPLTNAPLYSNLAAAFTAGGGVGGSLSGLRPVYVPALDDAAVDVIVGPARGFVWAEDPARTLQADVPSVAGRDIALAGGIFPAPRYADAFTTYTVAS